MLSNKNYLIIAFFLLFSCVLSYTGNIGTKRYDMDAPPKDLVWCGPSRETVLLLSENNSLYTSEDKGFNWRLLNGILTSTGKDQLDENENDIDILENEILNVNKKMKLSEKLLLEQEQDKYLKDQILSKYDENKQEGFIIKNSDNSRKGITKAYEPTLDLNEKEENENETNHRS